jgi:hypothetical protein
MTKKDPIARDIEAEVSIELSYKLIEHLEKMNCKPEIAYAALGTAFLKMHRAFDKTKEEWETLTKMMGVSLK